MVKRYSPMEDPYVSLLPVWVVLPAEPWEKGKCNFPQITSVEKRGSDGAEHCSGAGSAAVSRLSSSFAWGEKRHPVRWGGWLRHQDSGCPAQGGWVVLSTLWCGAEGALGTFLEAMMFS